MSVLIHRAPLPGTGTTPCCGRTVIELPTRDRITGMSGRVNCPGARYDPKQDRERIFADWKRDPDRLSPTAKDWLIQKLADEIDRLRVKGGPSDD